MADEIRVSGGIQATKGTLRIDPINKSITVDMSGEDYESNTQLIGTSEEAIALGDVTTPGYAYYENLDATNFVSLRPATAGGNMVKLLPGDFAIFRHGTTAPFAIADTAPVRIKKLIIEA